MTLPRAENTANDPIPDEAIVATVPPSPYTQAEASASLRRATNLVLILAAIGIPAAWLLQGRQSAGLLAVGAAISASGLWEWRRLMAALLARMDRADAELASSATLSTEIQTESTLPVDVEASSSPTSRKPPSIAFAITGFILRMLLVVAVLYVSLKYLHGSVLALATGLALGVLALLAEGIQLLRRGTI